MSATGRGRARLGGVEDFFVTSKWCVDRLLEEWRPPGGVWVEPGAGNGSVIRAVNGCRADVRWVAVEVREGEYQTLVASGADVVIGDFLGKGGQRARDAAERVSVVIGNPPYVLAQEFIDRAMELFPNAWIAFLLRIPFMASQERAAFMRSRCPDVYVLPNRPEFFKGGSDSTDYAWFVWHGATPAIRGRISVLASTPVEERSRRYISAKRLLEVAQGDLFGGGRPI